jgi:hypothetical protein
VPRIAALDLQRGEGGFTRNWRGLDYAGFPTACLLVETTLDAKYPFEFAGDLDIPRCG